MHTHFIFPADPLDPRSTDELFLPQREALRSAGYSTSLCPDDVISHSRSLRGVPAGASVVYRGWMLKPMQYERLTEAVRQASAEPLTSAEDYLTAHYLPNWYPLLAEFTPETYVIPAGADPEAELRALGWEAFFIKDYVKSLKTSVGSIIRDPSQIGALAAEMERFRGEIEGGLCVRRVEPFITESERRYFVLEGKPYSGAGDPVPEFVHRVAERVPSPFFSVDVVRRNDGALRVVEIGDGQVSDLVGWSSAGFAQIWASEHPAVEPSIAADAGPE